MSQDERDTFTYSESGGDLAAGRLPVDEGHVSVYITHSRTPKSKDYGRRAELHLVTRDMMASFVELSREDLAAWREELNNTITAALEAMEAAAQQKKDHA